MENLTINVEISLPESINEESVNKAILKAKQVIEDAKKELENKLKAEFVKRRKQECPTWNDLKSIKGFWIDLDSSLLEHPEHTDVTKHDRNIFLTEKHARRALAEAQISQLMPYYGGEIPADEWCDETNQKFVVVRVGCDLTSCTTYTGYEFIAFRTSAARRKFMAREENVQLVKDYFMMS